LHIIEIHNQENCIFLANNLLEKFFDNFENIYENSTANVQTVTWHLIKEHLIEDVKRHGSLAFRSIFYTESLLGYLSKRLHGYRGVGSKFIKSILINYFSASIYVSMF
jgi:hypothetical protein